MNESMVWNHFYVAWPFHSERQEPGAGEVDAGKPDVTLLDKVGGIGLVELKAPDKLVLNKNQWIWHERWQDHHGRSCVVTCMNVRHRIRWMVFVPNVQDRELVELGSMSGKAVDRITMLHLIAGELRLQL